MGEVSEGEQEVWRLAGEARQEVKKLLAQTRRTVQAQAALEAAILARLGIEVRYTPTDHKAERAQ